MGPQQPVGGGPAEGAKTMKKFCVCSFQTADRGRAPVAAECGLETGGRHGAPVPPLWKAEAEKHRCVTVVTDGPGASRLIAAA